MDKLKRKRYCDRMKFNIDVYSKIYKESCNEDGVLHCEKFDKFKCNHQSGYHHCDVYKRRCIKEHYDVYDEICNYHQGSWYDAYKECVCYENDNVGDML